MITHASTARSAAAEAPREAAGDAGWASFGRPGSEPEAEAPGGPAEEPGEEAAPEAQSEEPAEEAAPEAQSEEQGLSLRERLARAAAARHRTTPPLE